jgi:hypothetical protein
MTEKITSKMDMSQWKDITYEFDDLYTTNPTFDQQLYSSTICAGMGDIGACHSNLSVMLNVSEYYPNHSISFPFVKVMNYKTKNTIASISVENPDLLLWGSLDELEPDEIVRIKKFIILNQRVLVDYHFSFKIVDYDNIEDFYDKLKKV